MHEYGLIECNHCDYKAERLSGRWLCPTCDHKYEMKMEAEKQKNIRIELEKFKQLGVFSYLGKIDSKGLNEFISDELASQIFNSKRLEVRDFFSALNDGKKYVSEDGHPRTFNDDFVKERLKINISAVEFAKKILNDSLPISLYGSCMVWFRYLKKELKYQYNTEDVIQN